MNRQQRSVLRLIPRLVIGGLVALTAVACGDMAVRDDGAAIATTVTPTPTMAAPTTAPVVARAFDIYLRTGPEDCSAVVARPRSSTADDLMVDAVSQLLAGLTTAEQAEGLESWFSADTKGMLRGVVIANRVARVSFDTALRTTIPNASSSCGSAGLMSQLNFTILQFGTVDSVVYSLDGDVAAFYEWLQALPPTL